MLVIEKQKCKEQQDSKINGKGSSNPNTLYYHSSTKALNSLLKYSAGSVGGS